MNPLGLLKIYRRADKLFDLLAKGTKSHEQSKKDPTMKSLFKSKLFWFNILTAAEGFADVLPIPLECKLYTAALINIGLRVVTTSPVQVLGSLSAIIAKLPKPEPPKDDIEPKA